MTEAKKAKLGGNNESIKDCEKSDFKKNLFKLNGWKTTLLIVLVSLVVRSFIRSNKPDTYNRKNHGFVEIVPEKYRDDELVEWTPAPAPVSRPGEPGDLGAAVEIPAHLKEEAKRRFSEHQFDVVANELMSMNRTMPDVRYPECQYMTFPKKLPQVSVVIVYHNEAWSTLIRTVWSVVTQTPRELLKEVILVDDFSTKDYLEKPLQDYVKNYPVPVILSRTMSRVGLIQARLLGASKATGKVLVFLDAHCECVQGWMEALLAPIVESRSTVVTPIIDVIDYNNMQVRTAFISSRGSFDLSLSFTWDPIPQRVLDALKNDRTAAIESPAMAGGLFAIDREYFYKLGSYDDKMKIWGGENLEMSLRIWTCGGRLIAAPCSRVAHIFRDESPYVLPGGADHVIAHNLARFVEVWLDDYKYIYYAIVPRAMRELTDVTERKQLREKLQCKPFKWFLDNIFPESPFNIQNYTLVEIESIVEEEMCLDSMGDSRIHDRNLEVKKCHHLGGNQIFMLTGNDEIREKKYCLDATAIGMPVKLLDCHGLGGNQKWTYNADTNQIRHKDGKNCLTMVEDSDIPTIAPCEEDDNELAQQWYVGPPSTLRNQV